MIHPDDVNFKPVIVMNEEKIVIYSQNCPWYIHQKKNNWYNFKINNFATGCIRTVNCRRKECLGLQLIFEIDPIVKEMIQNKNIALLNLQNESKYIKRLAIILIQDNYTLIKI